MYSPSFNFSSHSARPLFYLGGIPFYFTTLLTAIHVACFVFGAVISTGRWFAFAGFWCPSSLEDYRLWNFVTYPFAHPVSIFFVIDMLFLFLLGRVLEEHFGRRVIIILYAALVLIPPLTHTGAYLLNHSHRTLLVSTSLIHFCLFLGVAFLEPNAHFFWSWFKIKWAALAFFVINCLQLLDVRDFVGLLALLLNCGFTYAFLRHSGLGARFGWLKDRLMPLPAPGSPREPGRREKKDAKIVPFEPKLKPRADISDEHPAVQRIDAVLEKIARHGLGSLTDAERKLLEKASDDLRAKDE